MSELLNKMFGYRWSIYLTKNRTIHYAMHCDSVYSLILMVAKFFTEKGDPNEPWEIYLNFNKKHQEILLKKEYFKKERIYMTNDLINKIKLIDPDYEKYIGNGNKPIFKDFENNKYLELNPIDSNNPQTILDLMTNKQREKTAMDILCEIFKK